MHKCFAFARQRGVVPALAYEELEHALALDDDQALMALREPFLRSVLNELARYTPEQPGPGLVTGIARPLQQEFLLWRRT
jgi:hypothetical protein